MKVYKYYLNTYLNWNNLMMNEYKVSDMSEIRRNVRFNMKGFWHIEIKHLNSGAFFLRKLNKLEECSLKKHLIKQMEEDKI